MSPLPRGITIRRDAGLFGYERALRRAGLEPVAGVDEAGRGACAGPLVAAAAVLPAGAADGIPGLADSKLLTAKARERCYTRIVRRAVAWSVVVVPSTECDRLGMHVSNVAALRRALARLDVRPRYVLTDGFPVDGLGVPGLAVWKGDRVCGCIAAASIIAKVTRDRIMEDLHEVFPQYDFAIHKGYVTREHQRALRAHGPCPEHRRRFVNVRRVESADCGDWPYEDVEMFVPYDEWPASEVVYAGSTLTRSSDDRRPSRDRRPSDDERLFGDRDGGSDER